MVAENPWFHFDGLLPITDGSGSARESCVSGTVSAPGARSRRRVLGLCETSCVTVITLVRRMETGAIEGLLARFERTARREAADLPACLFVEQVHGVVLLHYASHATWVRAVVL
jgi:hypothetical protein